ncbi:MAG: OmpA family protein [Proteobacteria bacterium]|nr:OmpA family protein [Pseudomonadota bacterium]
MRAPIVAALLGLSLAACESGPRANLFVVLPNPDGTSGAISVDDGRKVVVLDRPYAASQLRSGVAESVDVSEQDVQAAFGPAIAARPILPARFRLYFMLNTDQLTTESEVLYLSVFEDIRRRTVYQVDVVGHTDTVGTRSYNQQLSSQRATTIRDRLVKDGLQPGSITVSGRGEADLALATADEIYEPRNRRVEITVR